MPRNIELTQGYVALVDDEDFEELNKHKWCAVNHGQRVYASRRSRGPHSARREIFMHCEILGVRGVDHISHELAACGVVDNRKANLRPATYSQNAMNRRKRSGTSSKYKGVHWHKPTKKWKAQIMIHGRPVHLGRFGSELDAASAYDAKAIELFSEFALTNQAIYPADFDGGGVFQGK